ncbi:MAG: hypothetical protein AAGK14_01600 [Verrucomicrobiota bacterium]
MSAADFASAPGNWAFTAATLASVDSLRTTYGAELEGQTTLFADNEVADPARPRRLRPLTIAAGSVHVHALSDGRFGVFGLYPTLALLAAFEAETVEAEELSDGAFRALLPSPEALT